MCYDLNEYDPFHPLYEIDEGGDEWLQDEPMDDYNWEEWLDNGNEPYMV